MSAAHQRKNAAAFESKPNKYTEENNVKNIQCEKSNGEVSRISEFAIFIPEPGT